MLRDVLLAIQETKGKSWITIDDLPSEFKYIPQVFGADYEIHFHKIQALLWDYKISPKKAVVNEITKREAVVRFKIGEKKKKLAKWEKFVKLAQPDERGISRPVLREEFEKEGLVLGNGGDFLRSDNTLDKLFVLEVKKDLTSGNSIDSIRLNGYNESIPFNQTIASWIRDELIEENCVMLGYRGDSTNTKIEIDHKDGRKKDLRVSDPKLQKLEDFQPLCKAANDIKRQICKECEINKERWDATKLKGNPYPLYDGDKEYTKELGCVGCYQYDPVAYRKSLVARLSKEASDFILEKLYPETKDK